MKETIDPNCSYLTKFIAKLCATSFGLQKPSQGTDFKNKRSQLVLIKHRGNSTFTLNQVQLTS
jgi:hypothetical protein